MENVFNSNYKDTKEDNLVVNSLQSTIPNTFQRHITRFSLRPTIKRLSVSTSTKKKSIYDSYLVSSDDVNEQDNFIITIEVALDHDLNHIINAKKLKNKYCMFKVTYYKSTKQYNYYNPNTNNNNNNTINNANNINNTNSSIITLNTLNNINYINNPNINTSNSNNNNSDSNITAKTNQNLRYFSKHSHQQKPVIWYISKNKSTIHDFLNQLNKDSEFILLPPMFQKNLALLLSYSKKEISNFFFEFCFLLNSLIINLPIFMSKIYFLEFFELSVISFSLLNQGIKYKEGYIIKHTKPIRNTGWCNVFNLCSCKKFVKKWYIIQNDLLYFLDNSSDVMGKDIFWFDHDIKVEISNKYGFQSPKIRILNFRRELVLKFDNDIEQKLFETEILKKISINQNKTNEYSSYSSQHDLCSAKYFIDANDYYSHLFNKLYQAKESIFIAGWWVSPELPLIRPFKTESFNEETIKSSYILKNLLLEKAKKGVKVHLLIYKEVSLALPLDSFHTKNTFNNLHPNIKVTRHPKNSLDMLWSNHEKIVIIDQIFGYIGGIDLCWGRFDNHNHVLFDEKKQENTNINNHSSLKKSEVMFPGIDYSNARVSDFVNVNDVTCESVSREKYPRMPWHDVSCFIEGPVVVDLSKHFIERWNFARSENSQLRPEEKHTITDIKSNIDYHNEFLALQKENSLGFMRKNFNSKYGDFYNSSDLSPNNRVYLGNSNKNDINGNNSSILHQTHDHIGNQGVPNINMTKSNFDNIANRNDVGLSGNYSYMDYNSNYIPYNQLNQNDHKKTKSMMITDDLKYNNYNNNSTNILNSKESLKQIDVSNKELSESNRNSNVDAITNADFNKDNYQIKSNLTGSININNNSKGSNSNNTNSNGSNSNNSNESNTNNISNEKCTMNANNNVLADVSSYYLEIKENNDKAKINNNNNNNNNTTLKDFSFSSNNNDDLFNNRISNITNITCIDKNIKNKPVYTTCISEHQEYGNYINNYSNANNTLMSNSYNGFSYIRPSKHTSYNTSKIEDIELCSKKFEANLKSKIDKSKKKGLNLNKNINKKMKNSFNNVSEIPLKNDYYDIDGVISSTKNGNNSNDINNMNNSDDDSESIQIKEKLVIRDGNDNSYKKVKNKISNDHEPNYIDNSELLTENNKNYNSFVYKNKFNSDFSFNYNNKENQADDNRITEVSESNSDNSKANSKNKSRYKMNKDDVNTTLSEPLLQKKKSNSNPNSNKTPNKRVSKTSIKKNRKISNESNTYKSKQNKDSKENNVVELSNEDGFNYSRYSSMYSKKNNSIKTKNTKNTKITKITNTTSNNKSNKNSFISRIRKSFYNKTMKLKNGIKNVFKRGTQIPDEINLYNPIDEHNSTTKLKNKFNMNCQIIRSASFWSTGIEKDENSILNAYCKLISEAKRFIYIENQFFISKSYTDEEASSSEDLKADEVYNEIALFIRQRIEKAYLTNQKFKVYIFIPLIPGFAGEIKDSIVIQTIIRHTYKTICRGKGFSLLERLFSLMNDRYEDYISFFSLRKHELNPYTKIPFTELIYIHSKIMIIDDEVAIIGSANINDRSMIGNRDSEIGIVIKENLDYEINISNSDDINDIYDVYHNSENDYSSRNTNSTDIADNFDIYRNRYSINVNSNRNSDKYNDKDTIFGIDYKLHLSNKISVSKFCYSMRVKLMQEHLGLPVYKDIAKTPFILMDPHSNRTFSYIKDVAEENSKIYSIIFENICPTNDQLTIRQIRKAEYDYENKEQKRSLILKYNRLKNQIKGHIVEFPLDFLSNEKLHRPTICKERLVPLKNFL